MPYRDSPTYDECVEALEVMLERYGYARTLEMLTTARENLRKEREVTP